MGNNENVTAQLVSQPYLISEFVLQGYVLTSRQNFESTWAWWQTIAIKAQDERKKIRWSRPINYLNREAKHVNNYHNYAASLFPNSISAVYCTEFHPKSFQKWNVLQSRKNEKEKLKSFVSYFSSCINWKFNFGVIQEQMLSNICSKQSLCCIEYG